MTPRIVFLVMSAVTPAETVDQLARALMPHTVLVHHDFAQTPCFPLTSPNVRFVPEPRRTGWGSFGFVDGIFHSLKYACDELAFDYLQLLSPTCMPIKPVAAFEAHVSGSAEAHFDCIDLLRDPDCLMWVGYRAFTPFPSFRHRLLRRLSVDYFRGSSGRRDEAGVWLKSGGGTGLQARVARWLVKAFSLPAIGGHILGKGFWPYYGSAWFGARRHVVASMIEGYGRPGVRAYFSRVRLAEEFLIPTLLMDARVAKGPSNHLIQKFNEARVGYFGEDELDRLARSPAFFARKFPDEADAPVRAQVLRELVDVSSPAPVPVPVDVREPAPAGGSGGVLEGTVGAAMGTPLPQMAGGALGTF